MSESNGYIKTILANAPHTQAKEVRLAVNKMYPRTWEGIETCIIASGNVHSVFVIHGGYMVYFKDNSYMKYVRAGDGVDFEIGMSVKVPSTKTGIQ